MLIQCKYLELPEPFRGVTIRSKWIFLLHQTKKPSYLSCVKSITQKYNIKGSEKNLEVSHFEHPFQRFYLWTKTFIGADLWKYGYMLPRPIHTSQNIPNRVKIGSVIKEMKFSNGNQMGFFGASKTASKTLQRCLNLIQMDFPFAPNSKPLLSIMCQEDYTKRIY